MRPRSRAASSSANQTHRCSVEPSARVMVMVMARKPTGATNELAEDWVDEDWVDEEWVAEDR